MATSDDSPSDYVMHPSHPNQCEGPLSPIYSSPSAFDIDSFDTPVGSGEPQFSGQDADPYASQAQSFGGIWNQSFEENCWSRLTYGPPDVQNQAHNVSQAEDTSSKLATQIHTEKQAESAHPALHAQNERLGFYQDSSTLGFPKSRLAPVIHGQEDPLEARLQNPYFTRYTRPESPSTKPVMTEESGKSVRKFPCAFRAAQERLNLPYTCSAAPVTTVSALRTHLKRTLPGKKPPHLAFLRRCPTCNEDILDEFEFGEQHGTEKCTTPLQQRRGNEGQVQQYKMLCAKVERYIRHAARYEEQSGVRHTRIADPPHVLIRDTPTEYEIGQSQDFPMEMNIQLSSWNPLSSQGTRTSGKRESPPTFVPPVEQLPRAESLWQRFSAPAWLPRSLSFWSESQIQNWNDAMQLDDNEQEYPLESATSNLYPHITPNRSDILDEDRVSGSYHDEQWFTPELNFNTATSAQIRIGRHHSLVNNDATSLLTSQNVHVMACSPPPADSGTFLDVHSPPSSITINEGLKPKSALRRSSIISISSASTEASLGDQSDTEAVCCDLPACEVQFTGRYGKGNLARHKRLRHGESNTYTCVVDTCAKEFKRQDARLKHYRKHHPQLAADNPYRPRPQGLRSKITT